MRELSTGTLTAGGSPIKAALKTSQQAAIEGWLMRSRIVHNSLAARKLNAFSMTISTLAAAA